MNALISGGSGLIGSALVDSLLAAGHTVTVLSRSLDPVTSTNPNYYRLYWDGRTTNDWAETLDDIDAVVHLAGASIADGRWTEERKKVLRDSRVQSGQALVKAIQASESKPEVFIQASAVGYYGPRGNEIVDEDTGPGDDFLSKLSIDWEATTAEIETFGIRRPVIRIGIVLSEEGGALPRITMPFKLFAGGKIGDGKQWWSWIHIEDQVRAIQFLLEHETATGPFNLVAPNAVQNKDFADAVGSVMGRPSFFPAPAIAMETLFGDMSTVLLDGQHVVPRRLQELGFEFRYPQLDGALRDLLK